MNIEALRVFCEVARQRSFSRAAATLDMTQSAASQAVQHLERELDQQLFDRSRRPPQLTAAGERFFSTCRDLLEQLDRTVTQMRELEHDIVGPVMVASIYSIGLYQTDAIRRFMEAYPRAHVRLQYLRPNLVVDAVLRGDAAIGLMSYPKESRELCVTPWKEEVMVLACPPSHRLADRSSVALSELADEGFIAFDPDLPIRKRIDAAFSRVKTEIRVLMEFDNIETMKQAIEIGQGVSILPRDTVRLAVEAGTLAAVPLEPSDLVRPVGIVHKAGRPLSAAAMKFVELLTGKAFRPGVEPPPKPTAPNSVAVV